MLILSHYLLNCCTAWIRREISYEPLGAPRAHEGCGRLFRRVVACLCLLSLEGHLLAFLLSWGLLSLELLSWDLLS